MQKEVAIQDRVFPLIQKDVALGRSWAPDIGHCFHAQASNPGVYPIRGGGRLDRVIKTHGSIHGKAASAGQTNAIDGAAAFVRGTAPEPRVRPIHSEWAVQEQSEVSA